MAHWETESKNSEWFAPKYIFTALECEFDMDAASPIDRTFTHVPAKEFITEDSLNKVWKGFVWLNPPWSGRNNKSLWLDKMNDHGNGIVLTPDRSSAPWWQRAAKQCDFVFFVDGKIKFIKPDGSTGDQPGTGTTLFGWGTLAAIAFNNAEKNKLGIMFKRVL